MVVSQVFKSQSRVESASRRKCLTVFSPPGLFIETSKYPIITAGILASPEATDWLSIYDHPESWRGLERDAIFSMREKLFRFVLPVDSRKMEPKDVVEVLQTLALSVSPVALNVQINHISPPDLHSIGGLLPCGPIIKTDSIEIVSEPEITKVAQRITGQDIPASEAIWSLLNYDYTIDQIARLMSVGLLGHFEYRRMVPLRSAYKATIDTIISRAMIELADSRRDDESRIYMSSMFGDSFTVLSIPGEPRVDYLRMEKRSNGLTCTSSLEDLHCPSTDITTANLADHARFSAYTTMAADSLASHLVIFHLSRNARSNSLGPWISRAGVKDALLSTPVPMKDKGNALAVLTSVLRPELGRWASDIPLPELLGLEETTHPLVHTSV
ncbi:MAG: hypothetical protein ACW97O_04530 [Candidatus Thorarchaeota archaeon]|jgi:hypothetical protein